MKARSRAKAFRNWDDLDKWVRERGEEGYEVKSVFPTLVCEENVGMVEYLIVMTLTEIAETAKTAGSARL